MFQQNLSAKNNPCSMGKINTSRSFIDFDPELINAIKGSTKLALVGHRMPDADCTASIIALKETLEHLGKKVDLYLEDGYKTNFKTFAGVDGIKDTVPADAKYDSVIFLDTATRKRAGFEGNFKNDKIICVDHHAYTDKCDRYGDFSYVGGNSSASEIMVSLIPELGGAVQDLSNDARAFLLYGINTDTNNLSTKTTSDDTRIIAKMLEDSLPSNYYNEKINEVETCKAITKLHNYVTDRMKISEDNRVVISTISQKEMKELGVNTSDCSFSKMIASRATKALGKEPDVTIAIVEKKNGIDISLRCSEDSKLNSKFLLKFLSYNAGGKPSASGVFIPQNEKNLEP